VVIQAQCKVRLRFLDRFIDLVPGEVAALHDDIIRRLVDMEPSHVTIINDPPAPTIGCWIRWLVLPDPDGELRGPAKVVDLDQREEGSWALVISEGQPLWLRAKHIVTLRLDENQRRNPGS
jgi:hypothetical protein